MYSKRKHILFAAAAPLISTGISLLAVELLLGWFWSPAPSPPVPRPARPAQQRDADFEDDHFNDYPVYRKTPTGARLRRNLNVRFTSPITGDDIVIRTDHLGFRGRPLQAKEPDEFRVLLLGDSITCAIFMREDKTYASVLEQLTGVRILNAAVGSLSLREELCVLTESGLAAEPDIVLLQLYYNDDSTSSTCEIPKGLLGRSAIAQQLRALVESRRYAATAFDRYESLSGKPYPTRTFPDDAWRTNREAFEAVIASACGEWGFAWFQPYWDELAPELQIMSEVTQRHGIELIVALMPVKIQVEADFINNRPQQMFNRLMTERGLKHVDLLPSLRAAYREAETSLSYDHCHLTTPGHQAVAKALAPIIDDARRRRTATQPTTRDAMRRNSSRGMMRPNVAGSMNP